MLRGRKIYLSKEIPNNKPIVIGKVVPVISSSLAGTTSNIELEEKPSKKAKNSKKIAGLIIEDNRSKKPATIFMIIVLLLGFYILYDQFINEPQVVNTNTTTFVDKIDSTKDYVYYKNEKQINLSAGMMGDYTYKDIVININTDASKTLETKLNKENEEYKASYVEEKGTYECIVNKAVGNYTNRYTYRDYTIYESTDYVTIVVIDNEIDICGNIIDKTVKTYVLTKQEGVIYNENTLLNMYSTSKEDLVTKAISNRTDGTYATLDKEDIVQTILNINEVELYIDSKECLGIYYTGILDEKIDDHNYLSLICK